MKKGLCLLTALVLLMVPLGALATDASAADYTVAGKLLRQLWAGSGFSGTLNVEISQNEGQPMPAVTTQKPLSFNWDYIYVRPDGQVQEERRLDLSLMDGEAVQTTAHLQLKDGVLAVQADLAGTDWYRLSALEAAAGQAAAEDEQTADTVGALLGQEADGLYEQLGIPAVLTGLMPLLLSGGEQEQDLTALIETNVTRMDLWIEGYRQETSLGKLEDGTTTMEARYVIAAADIKAQLKQMIQELLADPEGLLLLQGWMGTENAELYLNPELQAYYFAAVDALPLNGEMTIARTVSVKGDTLALHLSLPFYDVRSGDMTLRYDRVKGEGDLPDENTLTVENEQRLLEIGFLEYNSTTDATALQGTLYSRNKQELEALPLALAFTLRGQTREGRDDEERDTYQVDWQLEIQEDGTRGDEKVESFRAMEISLSALFASKTLKTAATDMTATLTIGGESQQQLITVTAEGKTRRPWTPTALPEEMVDVSAMTRQDWNALTVKTIANAGFTVLPYFNLTETEPTVSPEPTPTLIPTVDPASLPKEENAAGTEGAAETAAP